MSHPDQLLNKALEMIARVGWQAFTLEKLSHEIEVPVAEVLDVFPDKSALLSAFYQRVDAKVYELVSEAELLDVPPKERVLEMLMLRLEVLTPYRAAIKKLTSAFVKSPASYCTHLKGVESDISKALSFSQIDTKGLLGAVKVKGTALLYLEALRRWLGAPDGNSDQVMAFLDQGLSWCDEQMQRYA